MEFPPASRPSPDGGFGRIRAAASQPRPISTTVRQEDALNQRLPLLVIALGSPVLLVLLVAGGGREGAGAFAIATTVFPAALIALAGGRRARWVAVAVAVLLGAGAALMLALTGGGRVGGLPGSAWAMFGAIWAWPLIVTVWAYAASFRADGRVPPSPPGGGGG